MKSDADKQLASVSIAGSRPEREPAFFFASRGVNGDDFAPARTLTIPARNVYNHTGRSPENPAAPAQFYTYFAYSKD